MKKLLVPLVTMILTILCCDIYAQKDYELPPKSTEIVIDTIYLKDVNGGRYYRGKKKYLEKSNDDSRINGNSSSGKDRLYDKVYDELVKKYPDHRLLKLRNFRLEMKEKTYSSESSYQCYRFFDLSAVVVKTQDPEVVRVATRVKVLNKAMQNVPIGSKLAFDYISASNIDLKDKLIEILMDKGYRIVAKEYLERLYNEQKSQQSGIFNESTTAQENNFSAVGYFISVWEIFDSFKVQVVNVSTGEFEGVAKENYNY